MPLGLLRPPAEQRIIRTLAPLLDRLVTARTESVVVHSFSNGGLIWATRALQMLQEKNIPHRAIFDSAQ